MSPRPGERPNRRPRPEPGARNAPRARSHAGGIGGEQVEGRQAVRELFRAGTRRVRELRVERDRDYSDVLEEILDLAELGDVPIRSVGSGEIEATARTDVPQGVIAFADPLPVFTLSELVSQSASPALFVAFDGVSDPHNLGAMFRTALAAGVTGVVLPTHRSASITATVAKAAAGAIEYLPVAPVSGIASALTDLSRSGIWSVGLDADGDIDIEDVAVLTEPVVVILGGEGSGLSSLTKARCEVVARVPIVGPVESLNVSAACAVALFTAARRRSSTNGRRG